MKNKLFLAAVAAVAIHVIDDSFLQPNAGTSAGDHLVAGLVPLALLAAATWVYLRGRDGTQAAIALALVVPAGVSGAEAIYYSGHGGVSGDDYTGLLAMAAAPLLLGLGLHTLWTSRRLGDHLLRRYGRRALKGVGVLALTYASRDFANSVLQDRTPPEHLKELVPKIAAPTFFIHAGADDVGQLGPEYYEAATAPKQIWEADGGHTDGMDDQPKEYERRVTAFFDRWLLAP